MKRTKPPQTTADGRVLGVKTESLVAKELRRSVKETQRSESLIGKPRATVTRITRMCRTRMPLALTEDGEVTLAQHKIRMNGMNQAKLNGLIAAIRTGMNKSQAFRFIGMSPNSYGVWQEKARKGLWPYTLFMAAIEEAELELEQELLNSIRVAGMERTKYREEVVETITDDHGQQTTKTKVVTKVKHPQWTASAWILERTRPERYRSDREIDAGSQVDIADDIRAMKEISDIGMEGQNGE